MESVKFKDVVREKPLQALGIPVIVAYFLQRLSEFICNYIFNIGNRGLAQINFSLVMFYPLFYLIALKLVVGFIRKKMMKQNVDEFEGKDVSGRVKYNFKDIFHDKESFIFFLLLSGVLYSVFCFVDALLVIALNDIGLYAGSEMSQNILLVLAVAAAGFLVVFLQNTLIYWLVHTEQGNIAFSYIVAGSGIITFLIMIGISNIGASGQEIADDMLLGMLLPVDISTTAWFLMTIWLWNKARKCSHCKASLIRTGLIVAGVSFLISLTPIADGISMLWIAINDVFL